MSNSASGSRTPVKPSTGPNLSEPGRAFRDRTGRTCVHVDDVWSPVCLRWWGGTVLDALLVLAVEYSRRAAWRWVFHDRDARFRLIVLHSKRRFPLRYRVVAVEFFDTREEASGRRAEILENWASHQWDASPAIGRGERRRLRKMSMKQNAA